MKKLQEMIKTVNKRNLIIMVISLLIIIFLILLMINFIGGNKKTLTCTMTNKELSGFTIKDEITIILKENKVSSFKVLKNVEMGKEYSRHETYHTILENALDNAYSYVDKDNYKLSVKENLFTVEATIKDKGVIFNNFIITLNNPDNKYDLRFNPLNNVESSKTSILIDDEYKINDLEKKVEGFGYICE